jgi:hypothetical protein
VVLARISGLEDVDVVNAEDVPDPTGFSAVSDADRPPVADAVPAPGRPERELAMLAVRWEMTAVYLKLVRG